MPENDDAVLVVTKDDDIYTCTRNVIKSKNSRPSNATFVVDRFTHWMPLPEPPKR